MVRPSASSVSYFRNFVFGVEDSLVSTVGLLSGIAVAGVDVKTIFLTGVVLIFVEAFSMAAGSFLSESSAETYSEDTSALSTRPYYDGVVMFFSYFVSGFIPLAPYLMFPVSSALWVSIVLSMLALLVLGIIGGIFARGGIVKSATRMTVVGGIAIAVGVAAGILVG